MQRFYCETHEVSYEGDGECPVCTYCDARGNLDNALQGAPPSADYHVEASWNLGYHAARSAVFAMQEADKARGKSA